MQQKVRALVTGGSTQTIDIGSDVRTVGDLKKRLGVPNHTASVNGEPKDNGYHLAHDEYVTLAPAVKGA